MTLFATVRKSSCKQNPVPATASKYSEEDKKFQELTYDELKAYLSDDANEDEAFEVIDKIYDNITKSLDLEELGNKVNEDYRDNHRGGYGVSAFNFTHRGREIHGVIYDDGDAGDTQDFFENKMDFAADESDAGRLMDDEVRNFLDRISY